MVTMSQAPDFAAIKAKQRQTWATGDYAVIGTSILYLAETLCEAMDLHAGQHVLDVAGGSGNAALAAARRFCEVTCTDYVPELLERGRQRAAAERLRITFEVADAEDLPYRSGSFDAVVSTVGVMFAPDQERVAAELLRVCASGGTIGLANWTPGGFIGDLFRTVGSYAPPPPGVKPATLWGTEERVRELLGDGVTSLAATQRTFTFRARSADHWVDVFRDYYGPVNKAFAAQDTAGQAALAADLGDLLRRYNRATDGTIAAPATYLEVIATRR